MIGRLMVIGGLALGCVANEAGDSASTSDVSSLESPTDSIVRGVRVGNRMVPLDRAQTLDSVDVMFGIANVSAPPGGAPRERCYAVASGDRGSALLRVGTEDLGGSQQVALWFEIAEQDEPAALPAGCTRMLTALQNLQTDNGVQLGQSIDEVLALLGSPTSQAGDTIRFERLVRRENATVPVEDPRRVYDETSRVELVFSDGRLVRIRASYFEVT